MMQPKRTKFRKQFKGNLKGSSHRGSTVSFGDFALKATDRSRMTAREIEAARRAMTRYVKRGGLEVRMGSGKGNVEYWVAKVTPGKVLFEIEGVPEATAREAFKLAAAKLSVPTAFVRRQVR
jgi:large subunit ribosomal protein L16